MTQSGMTYEYGIDGAAPIESLLTTASDLRAVLEQETAALEATDNRAVSALQERKQALSARYQAAFRASMEQLKNGESIGELKAEQLRGMEDAMRDSLERNMAALRRAHTKSERVIKIIVDAARRKARQEKNGYSLDDMKAQAPTRNRRATSISVNTEL